MATYVPLANLLYQIQDTVTSANMSAGSIEFYLAGTSTPTNLFSDNAGTSIGTSITLNSGGIPESGGNTIMLWRDVSISLKLIFKNAAGATIHTEDNIPAAGDLRAAPWYDQTAAESSAGVTPTNYQHISDEALANSVFRYMTEAQISDVVTRGGAIDVSAAIQSAINTTKPVLFPDGLYMANNLTASTAYQTFHFFGNAVIKKNANGDLLTVSGNRTAFFNARFDGEGSTYTGHNLVKSGVHMTLAFCSSYDAASRAVYDSDGNGLRIIGTNDIYQTADASATGYDIEIAGAGLYSKITDIYTSQATGGIYFNQSGVGGGHQVVGGQFGKLTLVGGSGACGVNNCRINGDITIEKSNVSLDVTSCSADATIGDGVTTFSGIVIGPAFTMQSGQTFTATAGLQNCTLYVAHMEENGVTVDYSNLAVDNHLYTTRQTYTSTWTGSSSNPVIGDGTTSAYWQRFGKKVCFQITISMGSTTTYGSGTWRHSLPFSVSSGAQPLGSARALDSGTALHTGVCAPTPGQSYATTAFDGAASDTTPTVPHTWAANDNIYLDGEYYVG